MRMRVCECLHIAHTWIARPYHGWHGVWPMTRSRSLLKSAGWKANLHVCGEMSRQLLGPGWLRITTSVHVGEHLYDKAAYRAEQWSLSVTDQRKAKSSQSLEFSGIYHMLVTCQSIDFVTFKVTGMNMQPLHNIRSHWDIRFCPTVQFIWIRNPMFVCVRALCPCWTEQ